MGLSLRGQTSGAIDINAPNVAGDNTITLPGTNGAANQFYKNSGTAGIVTHSSMVEDSSGRIGIGITSTPVQFSVQNASTSHGVEVDTSNGFASGPTLRGYYRPDSTYKNLAITGAQVVFGINDVEKARIDSAGNFGIGTEDPGSKLEVYRGDIALNANESTDATKLSWKYQDTEYQYIRRDNAVGGLAFGNDVGEQMRIDTGGNVAIGTDATSYPLRIFNETNNFLQFSKTGDSVAGSLIGRVNITDELRVQNSESAPITFLTNNQERMRVDGSGAIVLPDGSPGIQFGTFSSPVTSTTLDDYEEGTWTPSFGSQSGTFSITYTAQIGTYTKVGNIVTLFLQISWSAFTNTGGNILTIDGMPFPATNSNKIVGYVSRSVGMQFISWGGITSGTAIALQGYSNSRMTTAAFKNNNAITDTRGRMTMLATSGTLIGGAIYDTAS